MTLHTVSLQEFGALVGKSRGTVQAWVRRGLPVTTPRGGSHGAHVIALEPAIRWLLEHVESESEARIAALTANPGIEAARQRKLEAEAAIAEANARARTGQYARVDEVERRWSLIVVATRERLLATPVLARQRGLVDDDGEAQLAGLVEDALRELAARGMSGRDGHALAPYDPGSNGATTP